MKTEKINTYEQMIGKTIQDITKIRIDGYDDTPWLRIEFDDGSYCIIEASHGDYTGKSFDEYPMDINLQTNQYKK